MFRQLKKYVAPTTMAIFLLLSIIAYTPTAYAQGPPTSAINDAILRGVSWIRSLEYAVASDRYAMSEYTASPIVVTREDGIKYVAGHSSTNVCSQTVSQYQEVINYAFPDCGAYNFYVTVTITWTNGATYAIIRLDITNFHASLRHNVYFGDSFVCSVFPRSTTTCYVSKYQYDSDWASHRHTIRHGNQIAKELLTLTGHVTEATYIRNFLTSLGYHPDWDIYIPLFRTTNLKDDYFYDISINDGDPTPYYDCFISYPIQGFRSYEYLSKVCLALNQYVYDVSPGDTLIPTLQAIHVLRKYNDPTRPFSKPAGTFCIGHCPFTGFTTLTPLHVARILKNSAWNGYGISHPSDTTIASGVRTAAAIVLWAMLRYSYGYTEFDGVLHSAASVVVDVRVKDDFIVRTSDGGVYYRPTLYGAFYIGWNHYKHRSPTSIADWFNMPEEYTGIRVSNTETTASLVQALRVYRTLRGY